MARCIGLLRSNGLLRNSRVVYDTVLQLETSLNCLGFTLNYNLYLPSPCEACPISQFPISLHYTPSIFRPHVSSMAKETPANKRHSASEASASTGPSLAIVLPPQNHLPTPAQTVGVSRRSPRNKQVGSDAGHQLQPVKRPTVINPPTLSATHKRSPTHVSHPSRTPFPPTSHPHNSSPSPLLNSRARSRLALAHHATTPPPPAQNHEKPPSATPTPRSHHPRTP